MDRVDRMERLKVWFQCFGASDLKSRMEHRIEALLDTLLTAFEDTLFVLNDLKHFYLETQFNSK